MIATLNSTFDSSDFTRVTYWRDNYDSNNLTSTIAPSIKPTVFVRISIRYSTNELYKPEKILTRKQLRDYYSFNKLIEEVEVRRKNPFKFINRIEATVKRPVHLRGKRLDGSKWAIKK